MSARVRHPACKVGSKGEIQEKSLSSLEQEKDHGKLDKDSEKGMDVEIII